jgi:lipoprotein-anchoring transpeptidase ErfK/SrfK
MAGSVSMPALDVAVVAVASLAFSAPGGAEVVRLAGPKAAVHATPGGEVVTELRARTPYRSPTRLWVRDRVPRWELVSTADAPGGAGWVVDGATRPARRLHRRIAIDVSAKRLTVLGGGRRWSTRVVVGGAGSPTPPGTYQVTDRLDGARFNGVYGARIFALSAYGSPRRTTRLAIHGYPPRAVSATESAGCVRVPDAALARLAREAPPGTPVRIHD